MIGENRNIEIRNMNEYSYPFKIEIDGSRVDEDPQYRICRIHRILGYAQALADLDANEEFCRKIESIYDHKGSLSIIWTAQPTHEEKEYLRKAWESIVSDYESNVIEHTMNDISV